MFSNDPSFYDEMEELDFNDAEDLTESDFPPQEHEQEPASSSITTPMDLHDSGNATRNARNFSSFDDIINPTKKEKAERVEMPKPAFNPMASEFTPSFATPSLPPKAGTPDAVRTGNDVVDTTIGPATQLPPDTEPSSAVLITASPVAVQEQPRQPEHDKSAIISTNEANVPEIKARETTALDKRPQAVQELDSATSMPSPSQAETPEPIELSKGMLNIRRADDDNQSAKPSQSPSQLESSISPLDIAVPTPSQSKTKAPELHEPSAPTPEPSNCRNSHRRLQNMPPLPIPLLSPKFQIPANHPWAC